MSVEIVTPPEDGSITVVASGYDAPRFTGDFSSEDQSIEVNRPVVTTDYDILRPASLMSSIKSAVLELFTL